jgi:predicted ester cyclase
MSIESTGAIMRRYWEGHDGSAITEDAVFTDVASGQSWSGREAIGEMLDYFYAQVFQARFEPERTYVGDGWAAVEGRFIGVHTGEFAAVPATGKEVDVPLAIFYTVDERGITEGRVWFMVSSFLQQVSG